MILFSLFLEGELLRRFLLVGQTGVGKSSFINATFGSTVAPVSAFEPCTKIVERFAFDTPFGDVCLVDTPGLSEGALETDLEYLRLIQEYIRRSPVHFVIYITKLNENRFRPDEKRTLALLAEHLGPAVWNQAWIVFTFAASVPKKQRESAWRRRLEYIQNHINEVCGAMSSRSFPGFRKIVLIDNVVADWTGDAVPIASLLGSA